MEKMIWCVNTETGNEVEMTETVTKDAGMMARLSLMVKPTIKTISQKEVMVKLKDATTVEEINAIMEGEDREKCIESAEQRKQELTKK